MIADTVVLFPVDFGEAFTEVTYAVPAGTIRHVVTGLKSGGGYEVTTQTNGGDLMVTIRPGTAQQADEGGVLALEEPG